MGSRNHSGSGFHNGSGPLRRPNRTTVTGVLPKALWTGRQGHIYSPIPNRVSTRCGYSLVINCKMSAQTARLAIGVFSKKTGWKVLRLGRVRPPSSKVQSRH